MKRLTLIVPSIYPNRLIRLLDCIRSIKFIEVNLSIVATDIFTNRQLSLFDNHDLVIVRQDAIPKMYKLRALAIANSRDSDFYMIADDDMHWNSDGAKYIQHCIELIELSRLDMLQANSVIAGLSINPKNAFFSTSRGLYMTRESIRIDTSATKLDGGCEESIFAFDLLWNNIAPRFGIIGNGGCIKQTNARWIGSGHESNIHDTNIFELNAYKFIERKFKMQGFYLGDLKIPELGGAFK